MQTPDKDKGEKEMSEADQFEIQLKNAVNNASWKITDVLLATPLVMTHIIESKEKYDPYDINPAVIIIDEFDELVSNSQISASLIKILRKYATFSNERDNPMATLNKQRQFIFTGATIPKTLSNGHDAMQSLFDWIPDLKHVKTASLHKPPPNIDYEWLNVEELAATQATLTIGDEYDVNLLIDTVKRSLTLLRNQSIMIFAESKRSVDKISDALRKAEIKNLPYYQDIGVQGRQMTLQHFFRRELPVLVCTNIASRGLDTMNVDHVIQFDFAKNPVDYLHRVGRTGRLGQPGLVTNFIRRTDYDLETKIRDCDLRGESYDTIIQKKKPSSTSAPHKTKSPSKPKDDE